MVDIVVPPLGDSVTEATIAKIYKNPGDNVNTDELVIELETDKVTMEVNAVTAGVIEEIKCKEGDTVGVGDLLGVIKEGAVAEPKAGSAANISPPNKERKPEATGKPSIPLESEEAPSVRKMTAEHNIDPKSVTGTGKDGRVTKADVINHIQTGGSKGTTSLAPREIGPREERVKMSRLRQRIAQRLKDSQNTAAILTTFNEVDMSAIMGTRNKYKDKFLEKHGVKLGFMSFFVKACVKALQEIPAVNAEIEGDSIIYKNHYDIGVAVGTEQGLVVPIVRDADAMNFATIEQEIANLGKKARAGKLSMQDMAGGTFTISNGGVYGSLLSTPIINPPQSAILGMHKTQERPVVIDGKIEIRPMMYLALSYDHRIIDGKEAVTFLVKVKEAIEDPEILLFDI